MTDIRSELGATVHDAMVWAGNTNGQPQPWQNGNSLAEGMARKTVDIILDRLIEAAKSRSAQAVMFLQEVKGDGTPLSDYEQSFTKPSIIIEHLGPLAGEY